MTTALTKLGYALGKADYEWIVAENEEVARGLEDDVRNGTDPEAIGRLVARQIGEHRVGTIARCISAAKYLQARQQA